MLLLQGAAAARASTAAAAAQAALTAAVAAVSAAACGPSGSVGLLRGCRAALHTAAERAAAPGQPTCVTHPELLGPGELAPGLHRREFAARRQGLANVMQPSSLAIIPAASLAYITGVIPYPYRQEADFLYLTGIQQQAVAAIKTYSNGEHEFHLFVPQPNQEKERWDGAWLGAAAAEQVFKADAVYSILDLPTRVQQMAGGAASVLYDFDRTSGYQYAALRHALSDAIGRGKMLPLRPVMHRLRWVKSAGELALMRTSAAIAAHAQRRCIALSHAGVHERALAAEFEYAVKAAGAARLAYPTMAGGGPDACTIHYARNDKQVAGGQVLLMDAGCEYWGYASDVTRTWPVGGAYTREQRAVYDIVLRTRQSCLAEAYPGNTLAKVHQLSVQLLSEGLAELGIMPGASADDYARGLYREFYCHSVGHYLGLDVHDTNTIGPHRTLEAGVVLALEPGLYIPPHPQFGRFAGIGVRIEDDVLVAHTGAEVLSHGVPVHPDEIEALIGSALQQQHQEPEPLHVGARAAASGGTTTTAASSSESDAQQQVASAVMA